MKIHHINAGTLCPASSRLVNGRGGLFQRARLVCHVLLIEAPEGLVLVDTGLGLADIASPARLGTAWIRGVSPRLLADESALRQVEALGFVASDVRHILLTHLDRDHAGGIGDFPSAKVHVHENEYRAAVSGDLSVRRGRYIAEQWQGNTDWALYEQEGENWFGFRGVRALGNQNPDILVIPLHGHTLGHCRIAIRCAGRWYLHAGDIYYFHGQVDERSASTPLALSYFQRRADSNRAMRVENQARLRALNLNHKSEITIFCSHDPVEYDCCTAALQSR